MRASKQFYSQQTLLLQGTCGFKRGQIPWAHWVLLRIWRSFRGELNGMFIVKTPCWFEPQCHQEEISFTQHECYSTLSQNVFFSSSSHFVLVSYLVAEAAVWLWLGSISPTWAWGPSDKSVMEMCLSLRTLNSVTPMQSTGRSFSNHHTKLLI